MQKTTNKIALEKVFEHARAVDKYCAEHGGTRIFTALFGSQNYGLDDEHSDVDTKSLIIPELTDWLWSTEGDTNTLITMSDGSHAELKPVVSMFKQFLKGNINFLEVLYTPYVDVAPGWEWLYEELVFNADYITEHNKYNQASVWFGYLNQMISRTQHSSMTAKIDPITHCDTMGYNYELGYNPKALMNAVRLKETIIRYFEFKRPFNEAIDMTDMREYILPIKRSALTHDHVVDILDDLDSWMGKMRVWIHEHYENKQTFNAEFYLRHLALEIFIRMDGVSQ